MNTYIVEKIKAALSVLGYEVRRIQRTQVSGYSFGRDLGCFVQNKHSIVFDVGANVG